MLAPTGRLGLVFTSEEGRALDGVNVTHMLKRVLKAAKLPDQRFHDLRHATGSYLLAEGVQLKIVSELLGHSDTRTTSNLYQHVFAPARREAAARLDDVLSGPRRGRRNGTSGSRAPRP